MGLFGKILATPFRIVNVPARMIEKVIEPNSERDDEDNLLSKPLEKLAQAIEEIDED